MDNFYELFDVFPNSSKKEIIMAYENKITKYNNIKTLSNKQIYDIKMLKIGLHVLINHREKYNQINKFSQSNDKSDPQAINYLSNEQSLDSLFNINQIDNPNQSTKNNQFETNIGERVFSLCSINKRPGFSFDFESELRKPFQSREDKTNEKINKD